MQLLRNTVVKQFKVIIYTQYKKKLKHKTSTGLKLLQDSAFCCEGVDIAKTVVNSLSHLSLSLTFSPF